MTENLHQPELIRDDDGVAFSVRCALEDCGASIWAGRGEDERYDKMFRRDHTSQYEPGRAPDIEIEWVVSAMCSVCEGGGDVDQNDGESLICKDCGTTWYMDGTGGERDV